jgi:acyl-CoA synthetase (AMP-forming)/AMP-acid ligase II
MYKEDFLVVFKKGGNKMLLGDILISNAHRYPNKLALIEGIHRMTWRDLNERVNRVANLFLNLGMSRKDRIAIIAENCHQYVEVLFACAKIGVIAVCLNYRLSPEQLSRTMNISQPKAVIVQSKFWDAIESIRSELFSIEIFIALGNGHGYAVDFESLLTQSSTTESVIKLDEEDGYAICYSSGTTGEPKAALITHRNRMANCIQISLAHAVTRDNIVLLPFASYTVGMQQYLFPYAFVGATLVLINFSPKDYLEAIEREKVDTIMINYTLFTLIKEYIEKSKHGYDLSSVKMVRSAGQALSYEQWQEVMDFFNYPLLIKGLAMTEAGLVTSGIPEEYRTWLALNATSEEKKKFNSLGKALLGVQIKVVDDNDQELPKGEIGELIVKGENVVKRFWNQPQVTEEVLRGGWLHTGDLAMIDEEGYMYLIGRKDDRIRTGGYNVYPIEIEEVIARHPVVEEAAVFGVTDERWSEMIMAAVVIREGYEATEDALKEHCRKHLARYQVPKRIFFVKDFPRHPVWKRVLKKELAKQLVGK